jgi:type IV pilus assembly protein PilA
VPGTDKEKTKKANKTTTMKNKGFTLIELIAVIVVIVILAAIALPRIGNMRGAAHDAAAKADVATIEAAAEAAITAGDLNSGNWGTLITASDLISFLGNTTSSLSQVAYLTSASLSSSSVTLVDATFGSFPSFTVSEGTFSGSGTVTP